MAVNLPLSLLGQIRPELQAVAGFVACIFYQLLLASAAFLLLTMAGDNQPWPYYLTMLQVLSGLLWILSQSTGTGINLISHPLWLGFNSSASLASWWSREMRRSYQRILQALEHCLGNLKLIADAMDGFDDNVPEAPADFASVDNTPWTGRAFNSHGR